MFAVFHRADRLRRFSAEDDRGRDCWPGDHDGDYDRGREYGPAPAAGTIEDD